MKFISQHLNIPHEVKDVYEAITKVVIVKKRPGARDACGCGCSVGAAAVEGGREVVVAIQVIYCKY